MWMLTRLRNILPFDSLLQMYQSIIQPKIDYAITIWGYTTQYNINRIQRMQNRAIRAILNNYDYVNYRGIDLIAGLNLFNVRQRRDYFMSLLMFKCIHGLAPDYLSNEVIMAVEISNRNTRNLNINNVHVPAVNTECTKNSFSYCGPVVWNSLPDDLKECTNLNMFKLHAKDFFRTKQY